MTKERVDALPEDVKQTLTSGGLTPLLSFKREMDNGVSVLIPFKLQIQQDDAGKEKLVIYPMNRNFINSINLAADEFKKLKDGKVILSDNKYIQRDPETNCILMKPTRQLEVEKRLAEIEKVKDIELGALQKDRIKEGKPVELNVGGEKVTVGLDLRDKDHFKTLKGDMQEWKRQQEIDYDIAHPEFVGLVQTDQNRWEKQMVSKEGLNSQTLKEHPAQTRSSGMRI